MASVVLFSHGWCHPAECVSLFGQCGAFDLAEGDRVRLPERSCSPLAVGAWFLLFGGPRAWFLNIPLSRSGGLPPLPLQLRQVTFLLLLVSQGLRRGGRCGVLSCQCRRVLGLLHVLMSPNYVLFFTFILCLHGRLSENLLRSRMSR